MKGIILAGGKQAVDAGIRQADDLLSLVHTDVGWYPGSTHHFHAA